jgi:hypothetical protein
MRLAVYVSLLNAILLVACGGGGERVLPGGPGMTGTMYAEGRLFAQSYCGPCHASDGQHARRPIAIRSFKMDSYQDWQEAFGILRAVLDRWHPDGTVMPPSFAPAQPSDAERRRVLAWVERGSPNTPDGR